LAAELTTASRGTREFFALLVRYAVYINTAKAFAAKEEYVGLSLS
jgi:hypothetical protein